MRVRRINGESLSYSALLALAIVAGTSTAHAADGDADTNSLSNSQIESVTVTARRREEALQDVPLAVSVLNADKIEATGTINVGRLSQLQPSVQFYSSNPRNSSVNIRGLGTPFGLTNDGIEPGVGIYIDQVYYNRNATN
jgi:iron complex outermembrane receptor protein